MSDLVDLQSVNKIKALDRVIALKVIGLDPRGKYLLLNIEYISNLDRLNITYRDLETGENKNIQIKEPVVPFYYVKKEKRNYNYTKVYNYIDDLEYKIIKFRDIQKNIASDIGEEGTAFLTNCFRAKDFRGMRSLFLHEYTVGNDYSCEEYYRFIWNEVYTNDESKVLRKGFMDIEADSIDVAGFPTASECPINLLTFVDSHNMVVYTFALIHRQFKQKNLSLLNEDEKAAEVIRYNYYQNGHKQQDELIANLEEFREECKKEFNESFGDFDYKFFFYENETKMLVHFFQLVNSLKLDFMGIWNITFDIPYIMERLEVLGLQPIDVMGHPDFIDKRIYFKYDKIHHDIKNKNDFFFLTNYTNYIDLMELYASIRKGMSELRTYRLDAIAKRELKDEKIKYSSDGNIKTLAYTNFKLFIKYGIKDSLLLKGIEFRTNDIDTLYSLSSEYCTAYSNVFKQTVILRNMQREFLKEIGYVTGNNTNFLNNVLDYEIDNPDEDEDDDDENTNKKKDKKFKIEGAVVADPIYNDYYGLELYGRPTNNIFLNVIDFDMASFYPNSAIASNIDASTLIFKMIMDKEQFRHNGYLLINGITNLYFDSNEVDDLSKECIDNFQTKNYLTFGHKWLNLPSVDMVYDELVKEGLL